MSTGAYARPVDEGIQTISSVPARAGASVAAEARDSLLRAIAAEARTIEQRPGSAGTDALERLARAFALVTRDESADSTLLPESRAGGHQVGLGLERQRPRSSA